MLAYTTKEELDFNSITDISDERKNEILTNFADKHKMTREQCKFI